LSPTCQWIVQSKTRETETPKVLDHGLNETGSKREKKGKWGRSSGGRGTEETER